MIDAWVYTAAAAQQYMTSEITGSWLEIQTCLLCWISENNASWILLVLKCWRPFQLTCLNHKHTSTSLQLWLAWEMFYNLPSTIQESSNQNLVVLFSHTLLLPALLAPLEYKAVMMLCMRAAWLSWANFYYVLPLSIPKQQYYSYVAMLHWNSIIIII